LGFGHFFWAGVFQGNQNKNEVLKRTQINMILSDKSTINKRCLEPLLLFLFELQQSPLSSDRKTHE